MAKVSIVTLAVIFLVVGIIATIRGGSLNVGYGAGTMTKSSSAPDQTAPNKTVQQRPIDYGDLNLPCMSIQNSAGLPAEVVDSNGAKYTLASGELHGFCSHSGGIFSVTVSYGGKTLTQSMDTSLGRHLWTLVPEGNGDFRRLKK
ncbi:MAG: hypothetical protein WCX27_00010 [Candidatus Paceibacterota bacterium]